jgi:hypothetical protein
MVEFGSAVVVFIVVVINAWQQLSVQEATDVHVISATLSLAIYPSGHA